MPLSVTERRAAVRQFVAEQHGRPEDKRLDGPQVRKKTPEAILMSPYNDDAALRRQAALTRVRQRRAQRVLGTEPSDPVEEASDPVVEPKVPKSFARSAPAVMMPEVNPAHPAEAPLINDVDLPRQGSEEPPEDLWEPPPKPEMPAMPGPAQSRRRDLSPVSPNLRDEGPGQTVEDVPPKQIQTLEAAGALLPFFLKSNGVPSYTREEKAKALSYAAVAPQAAKKSLHRTLAALPRNSVRRAINAIEST